MPSPTSRRASHLLHLHLLLPSTEGCAREPYFPSLVPEASVADRPFPLRLTCKSRQRIPFINLNIKSAFTSHCLIPPAFRTHCNALKAGVVGVSASRIFHQLPPKTNLVLVASPKRRSHTVLEQERRTSAKCKSTTSMIIIQDDRLFVSQSNYITRQSGRLPRHDS